jgi:thioesterase domain-containing protein
VLYFQPLASQLERTGHPFYGLEPIGVDGREAPRSSVPEIASSYVAALRAIQPHGPYFVGGHSFGSWVAYELAQQLLDLGEPIERLVVLDTVAPARRDLSSFRGFTGADWILTLASMVVSLRGKPLAVSREQLLDRSWDEQLDVLFHALQAEGFMPPGAERRHIQGLVDVYRTQAQMEYRRPPGRPFPIVLLRAADLNPESDGVPESLRGDPSWGWQPYAAGDVSIDEVPGDHLTMMTHPHVRVLAERLRPFLPSR